MFAYTESRGKEVNIHLFRRQWGEYLFQNIPDRNKKLCIYKYTKKRSEINLLMRDFSLGLHRVILANHFRASQSARPKSTIHLYLCGKHKYG